MLWSHIIYGHRTASISPKIVQHLFRHRTVLGEVEVLLKIHWRPYMGFVGSLRVK